MGDYDPLSPVRPESIGNNIKGYTDDSDLLFAFDLSLC